MQDIVAPSHRIGDRLDEVDLRFSALLLELIPVRLLGVVDAQLFVAAPLLSFEASLGRPLLSVQLPILAF